MIRFGGTMERGLPPAGDDADERRNLAIRNGQQMTFWMFHVVSSSLDDLYMMIHYPTALRDVDERTWQVLVLWVKGPMIMDRSKGWGNLCHDSIRGCHQATFSVADSHYLLLILVFFRSFSGSSDRSTRKRWLQGERSTA